MPRLNVLRLQLISGSLNDFDLKLQLWERLTALVENHVCLRQRKGAAACGDEDVVGVEQSFLKGSGAGLLLFEVELGFVGACAEAVEEFVAFFGDQFLTIFQLGFALLEVFAGDGLQVVDVVKVDILQLVAVGIDVTRHGDIY